MKVAQLVLFTFQIAAVARPGSIVSAAVFGGAVTLMSSDSSSGLPEGNDTCADEVSIRLEERRSMEFCIRECASSCSGGLAGSHHQDTANAKETKAGGNSEPAQKLQGIALFAVIWYLFFVTPELSQKCVLAFALLLTGHQKYGEVLISFFLAGMIYLLTTVMFGQDRGKLDNDFCHMDDGDDLYHGASNGWGYYTDA